MKLSLNTALIAFGCSLASCVSFVDVKDVNKSPNARGFRYNLPATYVKVTPAADGSAEFETFVMEDPRSEYAIKTFTLFGKHKTTVSKSETNPALLSKVSADLDADEVAEAAITNAGDIVNKKIETENAARKSAQEASQKADETIAEKRLAVEKAILDESAASDDEKAEKQLALAKAKLDLQFAINAKPKIPGAREGAVTLGKAPTPAFYRLDDDGSGGVRLVPVNFKTKVAVPKGGERFENLGSQPSFPSSKKAEKKEKPAEPMLFQSVFEIVITSNGEKDEREVVITSSVPLKSLKILSQTDNSGIVSGSEQATISPLEANKSLLTFTRSSKEGDHTFRFSAIPVSTGEAVAPAGLTFKVIHIEAEE